VPTCRITGICREAFINVYGITHNHLETLSKEIKEDRFGDGFRVFNDRSNILNAASNAQQLSVVRANDNALEQLAENFGIELSPSQLAAMKLPNSTKYILAYGWMENYFSTIGDYAPNKVDEVHIEHCTVKDVHNEYLADMQDATDASNLLTYKALGDLWFNCFR
jgi:hypothetical protein